eukprot:jgi/Tetstr1/434046/TSEL_023190.t1
MDYIDRNVLPSSGAWFFFGHTAPLRHFQVQQDSAAVAFPIECERVFSLAGLGEGEGKASRIQWEAVESMLERYGAEPADEEAGE